MDYEKLDDILAFLKRNQGYEDWRGYASYVAARDNIVFDMVNTFESYAGWCNSLLNFGLVDYIYEGDSHKYIINPKGLDLLNNGRSTRDTHSDFKRREILEDKILRQTNQSFKLNNIQFMITAILAIGTIGSLFIQWRTFEIEKIKSELEIRDLKSRLDSIQNPNK